MYNLMHVSLLVIHCTFCSEKTYSKGNNREALAIDWFLLCLQ